MVVEPRYRRVLLLDEEGKPYTLLNPLPVEVTTTTGDFVFDVDDNNIAKDQVPQTTNSLNYGYEDTEGHWTRMLTEYDNDDIPAGQRPQLVNGLTYYYDDKLNAWNRWRGESGSVWTYVTNFPDTDYVDDGVFTVGSDRGVAIGGVATSDSVNVGDFGVLRITSDRSLVTTINNVTYNTDDDAIPDSQETMTNLTLLYGYKGSEWERIITDGSGNLKISGDIRTTSVPYGTRIDEASATVTYVGKASPGTATSAASWLIQKIDTTTGTVITWADGDGDFDNVWDNRAGLSYS